MNELILRQNKTKKLYEIIWGSVDLILMIIHRFKKKQTYKKEEKKLELEFQQSHRRV